MRERRVDLFLGGKLGLWVLDNVDPRTIGMVYTFDDAIWAKAHAGNFRPCKDANDDRKKYREKSAVIGLSVHYPALLKPYVLNGYMRIYNIHPGYLPWGRCYYPVFWALWKDEPAGCTLHEIDEGIDTGPLVAQRKVSKYDWDSGGSLHKRVSDAEKGLFLEYWPRIVSGEVYPGVPQEGQGSFHLQAKFLEMKANGRYLVDDEHELLRLIRCLSHPDYSGMLCNVAGRQYEVSARLVQ